MGTLNKVAETGNTISVHMLNIMFNTNIKTWPEKMQNQMDILIKDRKRSILHKRLTRW